MDDVPLLEGGIDQTVPPVPDGSPFADAAVDGSADAGPDAPPFNGGGPFLCYGCICDGTLNMCVSGGGGGGAPILGDAGADADFGDASACVLDAGQPCYPIPIQCLPKPTCACIMAATGCGCTVDSSGSGFDVLCPPKP
jgi:hypothetical protein